MPTLTSWSDALATAIAYLQQSDPVMAQAIARIGPCTLQPNPNLYETLIDAIISQQISVKAADAILARVRASLPDGSITPQTVIVHEHETLRALGLSTPKARYIRDLTERIISGQLDLVQLEHLDDEEVIIELTKVKGIGRWTAEMMLIFSLGRLDVLPVDDLGFIDGVRDSYQLAERPIRKEMFAYGEQWRPYRSIATWYMWQMRRLTQEAARAAKKRP
ncbi:MAG: DNA-3-methyladenine glycosylase [Chloroflexota bacterium]|nr:DNA-3-methyladenine glycosylase [Chloroflexota bacterium]